MLLLGIVLHCSISGILRYSIARMASSTVISIKNDWNISTDEYFFKSTDIVSVITIQTDCHDIRSLEKN